MLQAASLEAIAALVKKDLLTIEAVVSSLVVEFLGADRAVGSTLPGPLCDQSKV